MARKKSYSDILMEPEPEPEPEPASIPAPRKPGKPQAPEFTCTAFAFVSLRKIRREHAAGFLNEMQRKFSNERKTREQWTAEWGQFQNRPVR